MCSKDTPSEFRDEGTINVPAPGHPQNIAPINLAFTHADWKQKVIQDMNDLDRNPGLALALRKRGF